ncbi:MAG TPA: hypothetical protein PKA55_11215 [Rhodoblastus sp.]|nr:hypothetical protein [Rhodoblastus sp.]
MPDFTFILASVEREAAQRKARRPFTARFGAGLGATGVRATQGACEAFAAYAAAGALEKTVTVPPPPDAAALRRAIAAARNADDLRALRRLAARALHPDHGGDGLALAECNALIDDALEA